MVTTHSLSSTYLMSILFDNYSAIYPRNTPAQGSSSEVMCFYMRVEITYLPRTCSNGENQPIRKETTDKEYQYAG